MPWRCRVILLKYKDGSPILLPHRMQKVGCFVNRSSSNQPRNNSIAFTNSRSECCRLITVSNRITSHFFSTWCRLVRLKKRKTSFFQNSGYYVLKYLSNETRMSTWVWNSHMYGMVRQWRIYNDENIDYRQITHSKHFL